MLTLKYTTINDEINEVEETFNTFSDCKNRLSALDTSLKTIKLSGNTDETSVNLSNFFSLGTTCPVTDIDLNELDTSNVTNMYYLFRNLKNVKHINFGNNFNTSNVSNMGCMFYGCSSLTELDLHSFDTNKVSGEGFCRMFSDCSSLTELDISNFETNGFTSGGNNGFGFMFYNCSSLEYIDMSNFRPKNGSIICNSLFRGCSKLKTICAEKLDGYQYHVSTVNMFTGCTSLIGENGTKFDSTKTNYAYARLDNPGRPGYFSHSTLARIKKIGKFCNNCRNKVNETGDLDTVWEKIKILPREDQLQEKTIEITRNGSSIITPDDNYLAITKLNINTATEVVNQDKSITITTNGTQEVNKDNDYDGINKVTITTNVQPPLQSIRVVPTQEEQTIVPGTNYYGINNVSVSEIPDTYTEQQGEINITDNGTYDVSGVLSANIDVSNHETNYLIFNDDEWTMETRIPEEYRELNSIILLGKTYFDTGMKPQKKEKIISMMSQLRFAGSLVDEYSWGSGTQNISHCIFSKPYSVSLNGNITSTTSYGYNNFTNSMELDLYNNIVKAKIDYLGWAAYCPSTANYTLDTGYSSYPLPTQPTVSKEVNNVCLDYNYYIGAINIDNTPTFVNLNSSSEKYRGISFTLFQHWTNGILDRDMVPVERKIDNQLGIYDRVNDVFYAPLGDKILRPGAIRTKVKNPYQKVVVCRPTNLEIDTGVHINPNKKYTIKFSVISDNANFMSIPFENNEKIFTRIYGASNNSNTSIRVVDSNNNILTELYSGTYNNLTRFIEFSTGYIRLFNINNQDEVIYNNELNFDENDTIKLFGNSITLNGFGYLDIYEDNNLIRAYTPYYNPNLNKVYIYDVLNEEMIDTNNTTKGIVVPY